MGSRANLSVIEHGLCRRYYSHWGGNRLDGDLFWGPTHAVAYIEAQRPVDESNWLDEVWAEGGAVVDLDAKVLLWFGGNSTWDDVPFRRAHLGLMRKVWAGWQIRWASEGVADLANYVGYPREKVLVPEPGPRLPFKLEPPPEPTWIDTVASVRLRDGTIRIFPLFSYPIPLLRHGPETFESVGPRDGLGSLDYKLSWSLLKGGVHVDLVRRSLNFWTLLVSPDAPARVAEAWPGWCVNWDRDRYEAQSDLADGLLRYSTESEAALLASTVADLLREATNPPIDLLLDHHRGDLEAGKSSEINPCALRFDPLEVPRRARLEILGSIGVRPPEGS